MNFISNAEQDGNLKTETIERMEISLADLELKVHVKFLIEISELMAALTSLTEDFDTIKNATIFHHIGMLPEILRGDCQETFE